MIQFDHVSKIYGQRAVVDDISFKINKGEFITLLGTSGSGKTTTLKMINHLLEPSKGRFPLRAKTYRGLTRLNTAAILVMWFKKSGFSPI